MNKTFKDLTGQTINNIHVVERIYEGYKSPHWKCKCICGKILVLPTVCLINNNQESCGCVNRERRRKRSNKDGLVSARGAFSQLKCGAKRRGYTCELNFDQFLKISKQSCTYCGIPPHNHVKPGNAFIPFVCNGIDRKNNTLGYTKENSVACCITCNYAKRDLSELEWLAWLDRITKHYSTLKLK